MQYIVDDHIYTDAALIPDLGSWLCMEKTHKNVRAYTGLSTDVDKLPTKEKYPEYKDLGSGSTAYCVDTGDLYMYEQSSDKWYQQ